MGTNSSPLPCISNESVDESSSCNSNQNQNISNKLPTLIHTNSSPLPYIPNKSLAESLDPSHNRQCILPTCDSTRPIKHISLHTMYLILQKLNRENQNENVFVGKNSVWLEKVKRCIIIDCRYNYEYLGGHIEGAIPICFQHELYQFFKPQANEKNPQTVFIFHCEFSTHRGPKAAKALRAWDRKNNEYPNLSFPELYVLEGGYSKFYQKYPDFCTPCKYVSMFDENFQTEIKKERRKYDQSWNCRGRKQRKLLKHLK